MYYVFLDENKFFTGQYSENEDCIYNEVVEDLPSESNHLKARCYKYVDKKWEFDNDAYNKRVSSILEVEKKAKIEDSKLALEHWLVNNPIFSKVHNKDGEYYTVTEIKQTQLNQTLSLAQLAIASNNKFSILWNSTAGICEEWTFEELSLLAFEITTYVRPRISAQQKYEYNVLKATSIEEIESYNYNYDNI